MPDQVEVAGSGISPLVFLWSRQSLRKRLPLLAIAIAYFALSIAYSLATPLNEGPDEIWHYLYVRHIAEGKGLPIQDPTRLWRDDVPTRGGTSAPLLPGVRPSNQLDPHHRSSIGLCRESAGRHWRRVQNWTIRIASSTPHQKTICFADNPLAQRIARLVSAMFGSLTVWVTGLIALRLRPTNLAFASLAAGLVAFNPQFIFTGATVTNDSSVAFAGSLLLFCIVALWNDPTSRRWALALGSQCRSRLLDQVF